MPQAQSGGGVNYTTEFYLSLVSRAQVAYLRSALCSQMGQIEKAIALFDCATHLEFVSRMVRGRIFAARHMFKGEHT